MYKVFVWLEYEEYAKRILERLLDTLKLKSRTNGIEYV
jgi:hypothetical protein